MLPRHFSDNDRSYRYAIACALLATLVGVAAPFSAHALEFNIRQIADENRMNREPVISETGLIAWYAHGTNTDDLSHSDIAALVKNELKSITEGSHGTFFSNIKPQVHSNSIIWIASYSDIVQDAAWILQEVPNRDEGAKELPALYQASEPNGIQHLEAVGPTTNTDEAAASTATNELRREPSGLEEVNVWHADKTTSVIRISRDYRHDFAPSMWGNLLAWQVEKGWPFGWEIMAWDEEGFIQLTTNFYYDMAPKVHERQIVWYGWDGHDFEIFRFDREQNLTTQITSNQYDDVSPVIWGGQIAWEGFPAAESDIFLYKDGKTEKLSDNIEDDFNPRIWNGKVIWQGFDGDDFEIYYYDPDKQAKAVKVTNNLSDDTNPDLRDGLACWMGYFENWDAEIYAWDGTGEPTMITNNEEEDREPKTGGGRVVWQAEFETRLGIYLAEPK